MRTHAPAPASSTSSGRALPSSRGFGEASKTSSEPRSRLERAPLEHAGGGDLPIQRLSLPGLTESAIRLHPGARKQLDAFTENSTVKKTRAVLGNLGFAGGTRGKEARYAFKGQARAEHKWNKLFGQETSSAGGGGGAEGGAGGGESENAKCCAGGASPFPQNRHDASKHDPEANKPRAAPAAVDQTAEPAAASQAASQSAPAAEPQAVAAAAPAGPEAMPQTTAPDGHKKTDSERAQQKSEARKIFDSRKVSTRSLAEIRGAASARSARRQEKLGQIGQKTSQHGERKAAISADIGATHSEKLAATGLGGPAPGVKTASHLRQLTHQKLADRGVGREAIKGRAQADRQAQMAGDFFAMAGA